MADEEGQQGTKEGRTDGILVEVGEAAASGRVRMGPGQSKQQAREVGPACVCYSRSAAHYWMTVS